MDKNEATNGASPPSAPTLVLPAPAAPATGARKRGRPALTANVAQTATPRVVDPLCPNGVKWTEIAGITTDLGPPTQHNFALLWPRDMTGIFAMSTGLVRNEFDYFRLMFPWQYWPKIEEATAKEFAKDRNLAQDGTQPGGPVQEPKPPGLGHLIRFFGLILTMALTPERGSRNDRWSTEQEEGTVFESSNFGEKYNCSRNEFNGIMKNLRVSSYTEAERIQVSNTRLLDYHLYYYCLSFTLISVTL